ncbi:MAG: TonB family protein [Proteobacteria bacterium]|nr:TonB family protein [Pseudomonadota bacterium]
MVPLVVDALARTAPAAAAERPPGVEDIAAAYAQHLWNHIRAHRPAGLQLQGTAEVAFRVDRKGCLSWARLIRSSGVTLLDRLALRTVREASPFPAPPPQLPDARLEFTAPVNFL